MRKSFQITAATIFLLALQACSSIDFDYPKTESFALTDTEGTYLGVHLADVCLLYTSPSPRDA